MGKWITRRMERRAIKPLYERMRSFVLSVRVAIVVAATPLLVIALMYLIAGVFVSR